MARVLTNNTQLNFAIETSLGVAPTSGWKQLEPNSIDTFGAEITTVAREPITKDRQRRKGVTVDLDSTVEIEHDLTIDAFTDFVEGFMFASGVNTDMTMPSTAVTGTNSFTVAAQSAAQGAKWQWVTLNKGSLVYARGFTNAANNGLHVLAADVASTDTSITVGSTLVNETAPANARVELAGMRMLAGAGDLTWDWTTGSPHTAVLTSAADQDFTTLGLTVGQFMHIGSPDGSGGVTNAFENSVANDMYGYCRITAITALTITFDKMDTALRADDAVAPTTAVDLLFGDFIRNVDVDDSDYLEQSYVFEAVWDNLQNPTGTGDEYEYALGNYANEMAFELPLAEKAIMTFGFIGTDTDVPTTVRKTGPSTALEPVGTGAFGTAGDIARLSLTEIDETGLSTDFKSLTMTFNNNVSPEKVLGTLGASYMNTGIFNVDIEAQLLFTDSDVTTAIRNNTTVGISFGVDNDDGGIMVDVPSMILTDGARELPVNESVLINTTAQAFKDTTLGYSIGISTFPFVPGGSR
jgi:hypothetical protein